MVKRQDASTGEIVDDGAAKIVEPKKGNSLHVKVYSPFKVYFDAPAASISAENDTGPFDVLPQHHRFMSILKPCEMVIRLKDKKQQHIRIARGIMHVREDQVTVFLDV